ncbi:hypothetical protein V5F77_19495 [Xanthobacter sp. DSM 24535]|uniref:hypothetical protein n=1 Tax=Roseixanthobacter psychrophilus TaxID=3119917 RepID=UPI003727A36B
MAKTIAIDNDKLVFDGETIATHECRDGKHTVTINFSYAVNDDSWFQPVVDLVNGLKRLPEYKDVAPEVLLVLESDEDAVEILTGALRRLDEKTVKGSGYKWRFHKNDADNFPSPLHGHDYERGLKIDALTGRIFDASTKNHCETLKSKGLDKLHRELKGSADFKDKLEQLLPKPADRT